MANIDEQLVAVHEDYNEAEARIVVGFLQSRGIEAMILQDDGGDQLPSLESVVGIQVLVRADDAGRARMLLASRQSGGRRSADPES